MSFLSPTPATSTQNSSSYNTNNGLITGAYGGTMAQGNGATNFLSQMLGVTPMGGAQPSPVTGSTTNSRGDYFDYRHDGIAGNAAAARAAGQADHGYMPGTGSTTFSVGGSGGGAGGSAPAGNAGDAYQNYLQMAGYAPAMRQLSQNVTGQGAASGILNSGTTAKALQSRGAELNNQFFNNYMQQLAGLSGLGLQAGGLVANTGQRSTSTGTSTGGSPSTVGQIASLAGSVASLFSDHRLKDDIEHISTDPDGLEWVSFRYKGASQRWLGVIADQVRKLRPHAMGPKIAGFDTVVYGAL